MNSGSRALAFALLCGATAVGQTPPPAYGSELLVNGGFEAGSLSNSFGGWTASPGSSASAVLGYGGAGAMSLALATHIGGQYFHLKDLGGSARVRQTISLAPYPAVGSGTVWLNVSAYLGGTGSDADTAQINVFFLLPNGASFGQTTVGPVTREERNLETIMLKRERWISVPASAASLVVEAAFVHGVCCGNEGALDNVAAFLQLGPPLPTSAHAVGAELVLNGDFETGWASNSPLQPNNPASWRGVANPVSVVPYGGGLAPSTALQALIGGGAGLLLDTGGSGKLRQVIDLSGNAAAIDAGQLALQVEAYLGGFSNDADVAQVDVRLYDPNGLQTSVSTLGAVTVDERNFETVVVRRRLVVPLLGGTRSIAVEPRFTHGVCCTNGASMDGVSAALVPSPVPAPLPLNVELLHDGGFAFGWTAGSPLSPADPDGWRAMSASVSVPSYGAFPQVPSAGLAAAVSGGAALAQGSGGSGSLRQTFSLAANAADVDAGLLAVRLSALLGGWDVDGDAAQVVVRFLNANGVQISAPALGPISPAARNLEPVVMRREKSFDVPFGARTMVAELQFSAGGCCLNIGLADELSLKLVQRAAPVPQPYGTELLVNGDFEGGWAPWSPLTVGQSSGWFGGVAVSTFVQAYGSSGGVPLGAGIMSAGSYARDGGGARLIQSFDLSGNAAEIDLGAVALHLSGYFGGIGADTDMAQMTATFDSSNGAALGSTTIGPVTAAARSNASVLLHRDTPAAGVPVPAGTRSMRVELAFLNGGCCFQAAVADNLSAVLTSSFAGPYQWPGTGEDLLFATGVNAPPTGGPGNDVKGATGGDTAFVLVDSPNGSFDYSPLIVAVNVRPTGTPLLGLGAGIQLNNLNPAAPFFILYDGATAPGAFGSPTVLPGGMNFTFFVPPGLGGTTVRLQAMAFPGLAVAAFMPAMPANGIFATTEAHEIVVL